MSLPCTSAEWKHMPKPTRAERRGAGGVGSLLFFHHPCVVWTYLRYFVSCFCRFICRILICSKTWPTLLLPGLSAVSLSAPPQLRPNNPCLSSGVGPQLGTVETCQPCSPALNTNPPQKGEELRPSEGLQGPATSLSTLQLRAVSFLPCLHPGPLSRRLSEGSLHSAPWPIGLAFSGSASGVCTPSHHF